VTQKSGFLRQRDGGDARIAHVVVWGDADNDGFLDAYTGVDAPQDPKQTDLGDRPEVLLNNGDGTFRLAEGGDLRRPEDRPPVFGASWLDHDRDGKLDIWVGYATDRAGRPEPDRLFRGDGTGNFADTTVAMGVMTKPWSTAGEAAGLVHRNTWGVTVCDLNNDGWPDLMSSVYGRYFNALYLGGPTGFKDWSKPSGFASDPDEDWTTNLNAQCYCKLNPLAEDCGGVPAPPAYFLCQDGEQLRWNHDYDRQPPRLGGNTFSTACADVNNDGLMDLMSFEIVHWDVGPSSDATELLINDGSPDTVFQRPGNDKMGLTRKWPTIDWNAGDMTGAIFDFDNDGRKDILIGSSDYPHTRAFLFHQKADGTFEEVLPDVGIDHPRAHGVAIADFDGDGDLDVALGHGLARCEGDTSCYKTHEVHIFRNDVGQDGNWIRVSLVGGPGTNRAAIGARVSVTAGGLIQVQEVGGGYGHFGIQHDLTQHFGLGAACDVDKVEVRWPDAAGTVETFTDVRGNYRVRIVQGAGTVEYL